MKKIYTLISVLSASFILLPALSSAQIPDPAPSPSPKPEGVEMKKWVEQTGDGAYNLFLEAFVTGASTQTVSSAPCDVVLVLDNSGSMTSNVTIKKETRTDVSTGSTLNVGQDYVAQINGKEYYIKGFSVEEPSGAYDPRTSQSYTYKGYGNSKYYYKDGDQYYLVSRGSYKNKGTNYYYLSYSKGGKTYYLSGAGVTDNRPSNVTKDNAEIWKGVLYTQILQTNYYYRYGETTPTSQTSGYELYTGTSNIVYGTTSLPGLTNLQKVDVSTTTKTRLEALKDAVKVFLGVLQEDAKKNEVEHHIAITIFGGDNDNHSILQGLSSEIGYGDSYYTGLNTTVTNIKSDSGGTPSHKAMEDALEVMRTARDDASHVVVFFTDGSPNGDGLTQNEVARQTINSAYTLKNTYKSTVFSIGLFSSAPDAWKNYYLNNVSSNYNVYLETFPGSQTGLPGSEAPHDKYQYSDGADLSSIFEEIAKETGGATIPLNKETTTVIDVISTDFSLPEGAVDDGIKVYAIPALSGSGTADSPFVFDDADEEKIESDYVFPATIVPSKDKAGNDVISVSNYDFSLDDTWTPDKLKITSYGNWVGVRTWGGKSETKGNKLRIVIPIELKPDFSGGYEDFTNETSSGIYAKDENGNDVMWQFERPYLDFPSIGIIKNGMKKGESATFTVQRIKDEKDAAVTETPFTIILTGSSEEGTTPAYVILKDIPEGTYRVAESKWSWTYEVSAMTVTEDQGVTELDPEEAQATTKVLTKSQTSDWPESISETVKCVLFTFTNEKAADDDNTIYSEAVVKNKFEGGSVKTPGSTTITAKAQPSVE